MKFTVDRSKWYRGKDGLGSRLLIGKSEPYAGMMCCLGFRAIEAGHTKKYIEGKAYPGAIEDKKPEAWKGFARGGVETNICLRIIRTNDSPKLKERDRESKLRTLFAKLGDQIKFVGRTPKGFFSRD